MVGIVPALVFVPEGNFTEGRDYTITNGCAAGTNAAGQCTVTVQATAPGVIAIQGQGRLSPRSTSRSTRRRRRRSGSARTR